VNGRVLTFEGGEHREVERLLPWYANATLEHDERARVHKHLSTCGACRAELAGLRAMIDAAADAPIETADADIDRGWERLHRRLHASRNAPATPRALHRLQRGWRSAAPWVRVALAAQCAVVAVLLVFLVRTERAPRDDAPYRTLSAAAEPRTSADTLLVVFDPRLTDAQLRELLGANHARIVDGPNATGAFLVAAPPGQAELVRNALRASPGVAMAERLAPPDAPQK
jgi:anti-sigma factor RsiW